MTGALDGIARLVSARTRVLRFHLTLSAPSYRRLSQPITSGDVVAIRRQPVFSERFLWTQDQCDVHLLARRGHRHIYGCEEQIERGGGGRPFLRDHGGGSALAQLLPVVRRQRVRAHLQRDRKIHGQPQSSRLSCGRRRVRSLSQGAGCDADGPVQSVHRWECGLPPGRAGLPG